MRRLKISGADQSDKPKWLKWLQTININLTCIALGMTVSLMGPTLLDLQQIFHSTIQQTSKIAMLIDIGSIVGLFFANPIYDRVNVQIVSMVCVVFIAVATILIPLGTLVSAYVFAFILGLFLSVIEVGIYVWLVNLWNGSRPMLQSYSLMFGIGALAAPLIAKPFLSSFGGPMTNVTVHEHNSMDMSSRVEIPFIMIGSFTAMIVLSMVISFCFGSENMRPVTKDVGKDFRLTDWIMTFLISTYHFLIVFCETAFSRFLPIYAIRTHNIPKNDAAALGSLFWIGFTGIRILTIPVTIKLKSVWIVLLGQIIFSSTSISMLLFPNEVTLFYAGILLLGVGAGPLYGGSLTWLTEQITLRHGYFSLILVMTCAGSMSAAPIVSPHIARRPFFLLQALTGSSFLMIVVMLLMLLMSKFTDKYPPAKSDATAADGEKKTGVNNQTIQIVDEKAGL